MNPVTGDFLDSRNGECGCGGGLSQKIIPDFVQPW